jgi:hypothetical protein
MMKKKIVGGSTAWNSSPSLAESLLIACRVRRLCPALAQKVTEL